MEDVKHGFPPVIEQVSDPGSIYSYIRDAVGLRAKYPHIGRGTFSPIPSDGGPAVGAALRTWQGSEIIVVYNISSEPASVTLQGTLSDFLSATGEKPEQSGTVLSLPGFTIAILTL